jgi:hypothetical protein
MLDLPDFSGMDHPICVAMYEKVSVPAADAAFAVATVKLAPAVRAEMYSELLPAISVAAAAFVGIKSTMEPALMDVSVTAFVAAAAIVNDPVAL